MVLLLTFLVLTKETEQAQLFPIARHIVKYYYATLYERQVL